MASENTGEGDTSTIPNENSVGSVITNACDAVLLFLTKNSLTSLNKVYLVI